MKTVALIFALAVVAGCNGRAVQQADASTETWELAANRFWQYIYDLNSKAVGAVQNLKASHLNRELDTLFTDSMAELAAYRDDIQTKLRPYTDASTGQMSQDLQLLFSRLQNDMLDAKERSAEYLGELKTMVEHNTDDLNARINTYTNRLRKRVNKDTEEIRIAVATYLGELQSRTSQNLEAARESVEPYVNQAGDIANKRLSDLTEVLKSQSESLRTQLEATAQELRTSLEGRIDELTELLTPVAAQIREKIESILEKVKETATA